MGALLEAAEAAADEIERRVGESRDEAAREALKAAKRFTYNVAADCWPGWSLPEAPRDRQVLVRGLKLAVRSSALVKKLGLGPIQEGTGIWLSGAFELALGKYPDAHKAFTLSRRHYLEAEAPGLALLNQGYIAIVCELAGGEVPACTEDLDQVCAKISAGGFEDGAEWVEQLRTARAVFSR